MADRTSKERAKRYRRHVKRGARCVLVPTDVTATRVQALIRSGFLGPHEYEDPAALRFALGAALEDWFASS
jgi:hypothetical protein